MSDKQMVSVPRTLDEVLAELPESYSRDDFAYGWHECLDNMPAEQHHGEPVAFVEVTGSRPTKYCWMGATRILPVGLHKLYTHADPAEVWRLRAENSDIRLQAGGMQMELDELRAQAAQHKLAMDAACAEIAERDALLKCWMTFPLAASSPEINEVRRKSDYLLSASAEPSAPKCRGLSFAYEHPQTKDSRTVTVTRSEVAEHMDSELFEKLTASFCHCEPVGETNVLDCRCDEVAEEYVRVPCAALERKP